MKAILLIALSMVLVGSDCDPPEPPPDDSYCSGAEPGALESLVDGIGGVWNTIIGGEISTDRRSTVQVRFGQSYCSGVIIAPRTVLTAAHCGWGVTTKHTIRFQHEGGIVEFASNEHLYHPDYQTWIDSNDLNGRQSDIMLLFVTANLPSPYAGTLYRSDDTGDCDSLTAQGWGLDEFPNEPATLRESDYMVTEELDKVIRTKQATWGGICFGDSGGPLYATVLGTPQVAGITSTTMSQDCLIGSTHVKVSSPVHKTWIEDNVR
jgi:hypothetical protein